MQDVDGLLAKLGELQQQVERLNADLTKERAEKEKAVSAYNNLFKIHMDLTNKFCTGESQVPTQAPSTYSRQSSMESMQPEKENRPVTATATLTTRTPHDIVVPRSVSEHRIGASPPTLPAQFPDRSHCRSVASLPRSASENRIATELSAVRANHWYSIPASATARPNPDKEREFLRNMSRRVNCIKEASRERAAMAVTRRAVAMDLLNYRRQLDENALSLLTTDPSHFYACSEFDIRKSANRFAREALRRRQEQEENELAKAANRLLSLCATPTVRKTPQKKEVLKILDHTRRLSPTLHRRSSAPLGRETRTF